MNEAMEDKSCAACAWRQLGVPGVRDEEGACGKRDRKSQQGAAHALSKSSDLILWAVGNHRRIRSIHVPSTDFCFADLEEQLDQGRVIATVQS